MISENAKARATHAVDILIDLEVGMGSENVNDLLVGQFFFMCACLEGFIK